jgi:hypothetical protein
MEVLIDGVKYVPMPDAPTDKGLLDALEVRFDSDAGDNLTVSDYLRTLLMTLWEEGEGFSGKRPFGNSSWEFDLYKPLIEGGFIPGTLDEDGCLETFDEKFAFAYVCDLILAAFHGVREG